ncbi:hypothetical protein QWA68_014882 [Fusarium oxysporum]|nr:hypothetical protein QWA68_014882 [Fusarium oxysporum]
MFFITSVIVRELDDIPDQLYRVQDNQKALEEKSGWNFVVMRMANDGRAIVGAWYQEDGQTRFIGHGSGKYYKDWYTY